MASGIADPAQVISHMTLADWLDDLTVRFLLNLPPAELSSVPRLCFQVEEAQWFYEDFIRPANPSLPSLNLRQFCLTLFQHCPLLSNFNTAQHTAAYEEFLAYKVRVPVRGAILMDDSMDKVLLVRGWKKGASWSFPRGKINKDEKDLDCAIREVYEETGLDINAAGLVDLNQKGDGHVKAIDVIMREQHMKLFVFRGVALDTYFEPRTRKEIGKIQWYNVKDLPGFKKSKGIAGQGQGDASSAKFYMVAPFLGQLKKWIGQQRKKDSAAVQTRNLSVPTEAMPAPITEDETEDTEPGFATDNGLLTVDRSAEQLKRLLSIGATVPEHATQPAPSVQPQAGNDLLAILRGNHQSLGGGTLSGSLPHTPFEQLDPPFPMQEPGTPQPQHPRQTPSSNQNQQMPPQYPYSPGHLQQEQARMLHHQQAQRHSSLFNANLQGPPPQHNFANLPPHAQQQNFGQQQRQHSVPANIANHQLGTHNNGGHFQHGMQFGPQHGPRHQQPPGFQSFADSASQQAPLGSEPAVPEPSRLPPPKLNAHSMRLLSAFKVENGKPSSLDAAPAASSGPKAGNQQQAALLGLFKTSSINSTSQPTIAEPVQTPATPASPALTDSTIKPHGSAPNDREPILNEMSRTLPQAMEAKTSPTPAEASQFRGRTAKIFTKTGEQTKKSASNPQQPVQSSIPGDSKIDSQKPRGPVSNTTHQQKPARAPASSKKQVLEATKTSLSILQRPPPGMAANAHTSPKMSPKALAKQKPKHGRPENLQVRQPQTIPQFSILQRPGSSRSTGPESPLRHESPQASSLPQVLKRPSNDKLGAATSRQSSVVRAPGTGDDKKDQLLALFGKSATKEPGASSPVPVDAPIPSPSISQSRTPEQRKSNLLGLFNANQAEVRIRTPEPPPSPRLVPERTPLSSNHRPQSSQQHLLNLFTRPGSSNTNSPGTLISPFTLGSPATAGPSAKLPDTAYDSRAATPRGPESRSRLDSLSNAMGKGTGSGQQTPTDAKDMLLGYLNGVVQKESHRGAKWT
jgi:mRNA-decapping enzyme subunit 2